MPKAGTTGKKKRSSPLFFARLRAVGEKSTDRTAQGHGGECLSVAFQRQQQGGQTAGHEDQNAKSVVAEIVCHKVLDRGLDDRGQ